MRIRQAATVLPFPFLEHCLKGAYLAYARSAKFMSESSLPGLTLTGNCLVELYGLDMTSSYQHAFVYLRQLALHLRAAYVKKTPEALQKVYQRRGDCLGRGKQGSFHFKTHPHTPHKRHCRSTAGSTSTASARGPPC